MLRYLPVRKIHARQVLDSRGNPTVEAEVTVGEGIVGINGFTGRAMVPSGASTGKFEAVELRDGNREEYLGQSVKKAVENINTRLADAIIGENALNQAWIDRLILDTDGTENKSSAGANATLAVSLATARAAAGRFGSLLSVSWRVSYHAASGADDEYLKRWKTCGQHGRPSGIYEHANRSRLPGKRYPHVCGSLPALKAPSPGKRIFHSSWRRRGICPGSSGFGGSAYADRSCSGKSRIQTWRRDRHCH